MAERDRPPTPPPLRTNRTRRVLHPVLIGHATSLFVQVVAERDRLQQRLKSADGDAAGHVPAPPPRRAGPMGVVCWITSEAAGTAPFRLRLLATQPKPRPFACVSWQRSRNRALSTASPGEAAETAPDPGRGPRAARRAVRTTAAGAPRNTPRPISPRVPPRRQRAERPHADDAGPPVIFFRYLPLSSAIFRYPPQSSAILQVSRAVHAPQGVRRGDEMRLLSALLAQVRRVPRCPRHFAPHRKATLPLRPPP